MYLLKLRVGKTYYPVNWDTSRVCWDYPDNSVVTPTVFTDSMRNKVMDEVEELSQTIGDFLWEEI